MSELIDNGNGGGRKDLLKHLILQLHSGAAPEQVRRQLQRMLGQVPYGMVVEVEQELMRDGLPPEEVAKLCHLHGEALEGALDPSRAPEVQAGHPVQVFRRENEALQREIAALGRAIVKLEALPDGAPAGEAVLAIRTRLNALADVDKHYLRKEHLLFPFLEKHGVTGPPKVMWTKHDEARAALRTAHGALARASADASEARETVREVVAPAARQIHDMIQREENILLPMSLDTLDEREWWEIARQSAEIGFCLVEPEADWRPASVPEAGPEGTSAAGKIRMPTGSFTQPELEAILNALPLDVTFVDAEDRVRFFSHGADRVFARSRAVIGRKVQFCHPPSSVSVVDRILDGLRSGRQERASFWIELRGKFVHIDYVALRDPAGKYLGCLEVTQDLTAKRALTGEQRLLSWTEGADACPAGHATPAARVEPTAAAARVDDHAAAAPASPAGAGGGSGPAWATASAATHTFDARPILAAGGHPVAEVMAQLDGLAGDQVLQLITPFPPAPLVERARDRGFASHSVFEGGGLVRTFFRRSAA